MKNSILILATLVCSTTLFAQPGADYQALATAAMEHFENKAFCEAAQSFEAAFDTNDGKGYYSDKYNAACAWALCGKPDSAFVHLNTIAYKFKSNNYEHTANDADLASLHEDERWQPILDAIKANKAALEKNYNLELVDILQEVYEEDQKYRRKIDGINKEFGWESEQMQMLWDTIAQVDSINEVIVTGILDEHGWLGADVVSPQGNSALFLVIQHADLETQLKYLPMMEKAVEAGNARPSSYALLVDRTNLGQDKRQLYGSQIGRDEETGEYYVLPLDDPENVDTRRAAMALPPLSDYVSNWDIKWDAKKYKEALPALEAKSKK